MARRLRHDVYVAATRGGLPQRFAAGTLDVDLPDGVAARIVNPAAWVDVEDAPAPRVDVVPSAAALECDDDPVVVPAAVVPPAAPAGPPSGGGLTAPPRTGPGATRAAWAAYAATLGQPVDDHDGRDTIVDRLIAAGFVDDTDLLSGVAS